MSLSRSRSASSEPKVEINVVPLVDVTLVLLIIFMFTATFIKGAGMNLQLPSSSVAQAAGEMKRELVIGIDASGRYYWEGKPVADERLAAVLHHDAAAFGTASRVTVQGDARATHGRVVQAMTLAQEAGFSQLVIAARQARPKERHGG